MELKNGARVKECSFLVTVSLLRFQSLLYMNTDSVHDYCAWARTVPRYLVHPLLPSPLSPLSLLSSLHILSLSLLSLLLLLLQYPYEALFRSVQFALMDNACREYLFVVEFFSLTSSAAQDFFDTIMGKTLAYLLVSLTYQSS